MLLKTTGCPEKNFMIDLLNFGNSRHFLAILSTLEHSSGHFAFLRHLGAFEHFWAVWPLLLLLGTLDTFEYLRTLKKRPSLRTL